MAHTIQHYPQLLVQSVPLLESSLRMLQCSLDDLELAATFDGLAEISPNTACYAKNQNRCSIDRRSRSASTTSRQSDTAETQSEVDSFEQSQPLMTNDWEYFHTASKNNNMATLSPKLLPTYQTESVSSQNSTQPEQSEWRQRKSTETASDDRSPSDTMLRSGRQRRLEADEEQVYLIARNTHLALQTLLINTKYDPIRSCACLTSLFSLSIED